MVKLPSELTQLLYRDNPWWTIEPAPALPPYRRWLFEPILRKLKDGLAPVTALRGPRQVGKTVLQQQIIQHLRTPKGFIPGASSASSSTSCLRCAALASYCWCCVTGSRSKF